MGNINICIKNNNNHKYNRDNNHGIVIIDQNSQSKIDVFPYMNHGCYVLRAILSLRLVIIIINVAVINVIMLLLAVLVIDGSIGDIIKKCIKNLSRHHHIVVINNNDSDLVGKNDDDHADNNINDRHTLYNLLFQA